MGYKLKEAESLWLEPLGDKTMELHCDYCDGDAFQVYFEGGQIYYMCNKCRQIIDPVQDV